MGSNGSELHEALAKIAEIAGKAIGNGGNVDDDHDHDNAHEHRGDPDSVPVCTPKALPQRLLVKAARIAVDINPVNAPQFAPFAGGGLAGDIMTPQRAAIVTQKYWGPSPRRMTVSFMESTPANLRKRIVDHMNAWTRTAGISFVETQGTGTVRISRGSGGYWSYLGTDVMLIPRNRPTMNLQGFTMNTPESEYRRVVRHETGHTLGMPHEHMRKALIDRIDRQKAYAYFLQTYGWDRATVDAQVLTALSEQSLMSTPPDQTSIMCYQLPGSITRDGRPIVGGPDINATDYAFAGKVYPKTQNALDDLGPSDGDNGDWDASEDVEVGAHPR
jgi:astacin (peptidase family M12A)